MKAEYLGNEEFKVTNGNLILNQFKDVFGKKIEAKKINTDDNSISFCNPYSDEFTEMVIFLHNFKIQNGY